MSALAEMTSDIKSDIKAIKKEMIKESFSRRVGGNTAKEVSSRFYIERYNNPQTISKNAEFWRMFFRIAEKNNIDVRAIVLNFAKSSPELINELCIERFMKYYGISHKEIAGLALAGKMTQSMIDSLDAIEMILKYKFNSMFDYLEEKKSYIPKAINDNSVIASIINSLVVLERKNRSLNYSPLDNKPSKVILGKRQGLLYEFLLSYCRKTGSRIIKNTREVPLKLLPKSVTLSLSNLGPLERYNCIKIIQKLPGGGLTIEVIENDYETVKTNGELMHKRKK